MKLSRPTRRTGLLHRLAVPLAVLAACLLAFLLAFLLAVQLGRRFAVLSIFETETVAVKL